MAELAYDPNPEGRFSFPPFSSTQAGQNAGGGGIDLSALSNGILENTGGALTIATEAVDYNGPYFNKVGTAYIGGDQTGNARGANAIDIQSARTAATQVASGSKAIAIGYDNAASGSTSSAAGYSNVASGNFSCAFGYDNTASNTKAVAFGYLNQATATQSSAIGQGNTASGSGAFAFGLNNTSSGNYSSGAFGYANTASAIRSYAIGSGCTASADYATALGVGAQSRIAKTVNICGPQIIRKDNTEDAATAFQSFCGVEVVFVSKEVDLEAVADHTVTLSAGCHFFPDEVGVWVTSLSALVTQPTVRFGFTGTLAGLKAAAVTTALTATFTRERYTTLVTSAGQTSLTAGVTSAASAGTMLGRFYWKGILVEDE